MGRADINYKRPVIFENSRGGPQFLPGLPGGFPGSPPQARAGSGGKEKTVGFSREINFRESKAISAIIKKNFFRGAS